ncbi:MAG: SUMF1/EgtB/PvdO family nonheme iron enzyme [Bacteroidales bacterium]|nr:SUMF1/EgtB/PvdO family nonheme iron enzyme [Bacteroidales bacterium]
MKIKLGFKTLAVCLIAAGMIFTSCHKQTSRTTGWAYNDPNNGGFEVTDINEQQIGPGLVFIEGGTFVMGGTTDNVTYSWDNSPRRVTVPSFLIDRTEVSNVDYREYIYWLSRVYGQSYPMVVRNALPDTLVWRGRLTYNEPMIEVYFRHPSYNDYPVVGVSWVQANDYCSWRTDRVNELMLIKAGVLDWDPNQRDEENFNTDAYLAGQYIGNVRNGKKDLSKQDGDGIRNVNMSDGILLPSYRLPTEAEWEYAAVGLIGNTNNEIIAQRKVYPWNGDGLRTDSKKYRGSFLANFKLGPGNYMGVAGNLNDGAALPAPVGSYWPNDYGLYNMAGNVSEWVADVYRPLSPEDVADYSPFRGNIFTQKVRDEDGFIAAKDSLGRIRTEPISQEEAAKRQNYRTSFNSNYVDGDYMSSIRSSWTDTQEDQKSFTKDMYDYATNDSPGTTLINDESRVYKGGSWADGPYYLSPGNRRYLNQNQSSASIGFRCAMNKVGSSFSK